MKPRTLVVAGLAAVALIAVLGWAFAPRPLEVELGRIDRGPFETTVDEEGRTRLRDRYVVSAPLAGRLERITLEAGDAVAVGAAVASLVPAPAPLLDARTQDERTARVGAAAAAVERAARQADAARVAVAQARSDRRRSEELAAQGFVAPTRVENDRLALRAAERALEAAEAGRRMAEQDLQAARAAAAGGAGDREREPGAAGAGDRRRFELRSPVAGRVLRVLQPSEGTVAAGTPLIEIGDLARLEVVAELLTTDALQVRPGSAVRIEQWGGPGTLQGRVERVEPGAFTKVSALGVEEQRVLVRIGLTSPPAEWAALGDGYRVGVRIVTRSEPEVLRAPVSAVFPRAGVPPADAGAPKAASAASATSAAADPRAHAVFAVEDGHARERPLTLVARNAVHAWLLDGPPPGTPVVIYPPSTLRDGTAVRERVVGR